MQKLKNVQILMYTQNTEVQKTCTTVRSYSWYIYTHTLAY